METWKWIYGYKGLYKICNRGIAKSVERIIVRKDGFIAHFKERILKPFPLKHRNKKDFYWAVKIYKNRKVKTIQVHILVAKAFVPNPNNLRTVNHKDRNKLNNNDWNLEWASQREQMCHMNKERKSKSSKFVGVIFDKARKKWRADIRIGKRHVHLGRFDFEEDAALAYQKAHKKYKINNRYAS